MPSLPMRMRFDFRFADAYRAPALMFGVTRSTSGVVLDDGELRIRFGPWFVRTTLANVTGSQITGPYGFVKTVGPGRLSLADRGLTFATNGDRGLCICFDRPVAGIDPLGVIRHPAVTVTVEEPEELAAALDERVSATRMG
jgi:hypothetical protein